MCRLFQGSWRTLRTHCFRLCINDQFPDEALLRLTEELLNLLLSTLSDPWLGPGRHSEGGRFRPVKKDTVMQKCAGTKNLSGDECSALEEVHSQLSSFSWLKYTVVRIST